MKIVEKDFGVSTKSRNQMVDITSRVHSIVSESGISDGDVIVFCPHTTAAITINENADRDVVHDVLLTLSELMPEHRSGYRHSEGNSDAHCKSSLVGCSEQVIIKNGKLNFGTWQGIFFCEFDGPRSRRVVVQVRGE
ncbi:MAG: secondary thiamine-phosphate synthase enzyme YjbQ [Planctomycetes bacterium]|nr:secondary thiamine-phosphate synthase enzyme YjbQ [Planctomycetota bacterium]